MIIDSHCHLSCDELYPQADELIAHALEQGVKEMLVMCTNKEEFERARKLKEKYPDILRVAYGLFPGDAQNVCEEDILDVEKAALAHEMDVLGEIGLDYHWDRSFISQQKELLIRQLLIANQAGLPVSIHMRDASRDTMDILEEYARTPVIFHCFSGSTEIMEEALKMNSLISFAGPITYKNNKQGPANVQACPVERMLVETDSPYLSPVPFRGKRNEPAHVLYTAKKAASLKGMDEEGFMEQITQNYHSLFSDQ